MSVLSWSENCGRDEMPPQWMWPFTKEIDQWFDNVEADRETNMSRPRDEEPVG
jgi:hypothetical protein